MSKSHEEKLDSEIFLEMMAAHSDDIRVDRITLDLVGDLPAAAVLSRLAYWFSPSKKDGQKRTRIVINGKDFVAKADEDWWEECGVTPKQMKRIKKLLVNLGVMNIEYKMFDNKKISHYHLDLETYFNLYKEQIKKNFTVRTKGTDRRGPKVLTDEDQRDRPITREYKHKIKTEDLSKTMRDGQARVLSLFQRCFNDVFSCLGNAYKWLNQLGFKDKYLDTLNSGQKSQETFLLNLRAAAEYVKKYYYKNIEKGQDCDAAAYFRKTWENEWYLQKR